MGCRSLLQGNLPNPGTEPASLMSPALTGGFLTTRATWEAPVITMKGHKEKSAKDKVHGTTWEESRYKLPEDLS